VAVLQRHRPIFAKAVEKLKQSETSTPLYLRHNLPPCRQELERAAPAVPIR